MRRFDWTGLRDGKIWAIIYKNTDYKSPIFKEYIHYTEEPRTKIENVNQSTLL
jgi:hypothetical protein